MFWTSISSTVAWVERHYLHHLFVVCIRWGCASRCLFFVSIIQETQASSVLSPPSSEPTLVWGSILPTWTDSSYLPCQQVDPNVPLEAPPVEEIGSSLVGTSFNSFEGVTGGNEDKFFSWIFGDSHSQMAADASSGLSNPVHSHYPYPSGPCFSAPVRSFPQLARFQKFLTENRYWSWLSLWLFSVSVYTVVTLLGVVLEGPLICKFSHLYFPLNWNYGYAHNSRSLRISCSFPGKPTDLVDSGWCAPGKTECTPLFPF